MLFLLTLVAATASAFVKDSLPDVPRGWTQLSVANADEAIALRVALRQQRAAELEQRALEVSTPGHPEYGRHLTRDEVQRYTAPSAAAAQGVTEWIGKQGIQYTLDNDWISLTTTVGAANTLLNTTFAWFGYEGGGGPRLRTLQYSVPDELLRHVDLVQPTTRFGRLGARRSTIFESTRLTEEDELEVVNFKVQANADKPVCGQLVTPSCLKKLYNINYTATADNNMIAFASYLEQYARYSDLQKFQAAYLPESAQGQNFSVQLINGGLNNQTSTEDSVEANLDLQYVLGISHPINIVEYSAGGRGPLVPTATQPAPPGSNEPYLEFLNYILAQNDSQLPQTLSTSYGEEEQSVPRDYALKVCNMFMQLGARGVSIVFSSGDSGPGGPCLRNTDDATYFEPNFPAGCPFVTAVGATTKTGPEEAVAFSSGGFSIFHAQPTYQKASVSPYLESIGSTYGPYFNASGRAIPDVATQGHHFSVYDRGFQSLVSGTSASSPVFAGMVALLNAARKSIGLSQLGFLNPFLYNNSAAFTDITAGYGLGCLRNPVFGSEGARWNATVGWDPVTGLGTPKFAELLAAAAPGVPNA